MRSMRKAAVGLLVAAAVVMCPVIASADDQVNGGGPSAQSDVCVEGQGRKTGSWGDASYDIESDGSGGCVVRVHGGTVMGQPSDAPWFTSYEKKNPLADHVTRIVFQDGIKAPSSMQQLFGGLESLRGIDGLDKIDTSNVNNMSDLFADDPHLTDFSGLLHWDVSNVAYMDSMFGWDSALADLKPLAGWDVSNVKSMGSMFVWDSALADLGPLRGWDVSNVRDMYGMFGWDSALADLGPLRGWDVSNVMSMGSMFAGDSALADLGPLRGWDVSNVRDMYGMFGWDSALADLGPLRGWDVSNVRDMSTMFRYDEKLTDVNLSGWDVSNLVYMNEMFGQIDNLTNVNLSGWKGSFQCAEAMFLSSGRSSLTVDLSGWDTSGLISSTMFPANLSVLRVGPLTRLYEGSFVSEPSDGGVAESAGYTGRWTSGDGSWVSSVDKGSDKAQLAAKTQEAGFRGGTFVWQQYADVSFDKNAPQGVSVSGDPLSVHMVGPDAAALRFTVPNYAAKDYKLVGWNTRRTAPGTRILPGPPSLV
ncbi:surface protein [Bifidobacterium bohemicum]|nr:surface protein [Bifidobacterium bohemicum]